jgi:lactate dehydrogenase-like 2-hydroxyacid dehydrogenase
MMDRVYVTRKLPDDILEPLEHGFDVDVWTDPDPIPRPRLMNELGTCDGLLCMVTESIDSELIDSAPNLRVVSQMAVGVDNIDLEVCARRGIRVGHTPGVLTETVADTAFALLAAIVRRLPEGEAVVRRGVWKPWRPFEMVGGELHGSTLGIVGMGRIGQAVARRALGFDMEILYTSRSEKPDAPGSWSTLEALLQNSDHVVVCAALTTETVGLIGSPQLATMKSSAYLVNIARGPLVDTEALLAALEQGSIAGAALDVTDPEPLPPGHALLRHRNCLVVPHIGSASMRTRRAMAALAVSNLVTGLAGEEMPARYPSRSRPG